MRLSGAIVFEHTSLTPPADLKGVDLSLLASGSSLLMGSTFRAQVDADGSFTFASFVPWIYTLRATPPGGATGARWTLKSAVLAGHDLADGAFEVKAGHDLTGLVITFTDHAGGISGRLIDAAGRPITRYSIVVFPADKALWQPESRRIRSVPRRRMDRSLSRAYQQVVTPWPARPQGIRGAVDVGDRLAQTDRPEERAEDIQVWSTPPSHPVATFAGCRLR